MRSYDERGVDEQRTPRREPAPALRAPLTHVGVLALQRSAGNQALARMLGGAQGKLRGVEALAGMSLSDVDVVTDSAVPAARTRTRTATRSI